RGGQDDAPLRVDRPRAGDDDTALHQVVDERLVGREEHVGGRAAVDLPGQVAGGAEDERDLHALPLLELRRQLAEREGEVRGGEHGQLGGLRRRRDGAQHETRGNADDEPLEHATNYSAGRATTRGAAG